MSQSNKVRTNHTPGWVVVVVGIFVLIGIFLLWGDHLAGTPEGQSRARERAAIDECRRQMNDELQELSTRRFVRQVCDKLEADYRRKWNRNP